jgi:hypothetical protein
MGASERILGKHHAPSLSFPDRPVRQKSDRRGIWMLLPDTGKTASDSQLLQTMAPNRPTAQFPHAIMSSSHSEPLSWNTTWIH